MTTRGTGPADALEPPAPPSAGRGPRALGNRAVLVSSASTVLLFALVAAAVVLAPGSRLVAERFFGPFYLKQSLLGAESAPSVVGAWASRAIPRTSSASSRGQDPGTGRARADLHRARAPANFRSA